MKRLWFVKTHPRVHEDEVHLGEGEDHLRIDKIEIIKIIKQNHHNLFLLIFYGCLCQCSSFSSISTGLSFPIVLLVNFSDLIKIKIFLCLFLVKRFEMIVDNHLKHRVHSTHCLKCNNLLEIVTISDKAWFFFFKTRQYRILIV